MTGPGRLCEFANVSYPVPNLLAMQPIHDLSYMRSATALECRATAVTQSPS